MPTDPGDVFAVDGLEERRLTCVNADLLESLALAAPSRWRSSGPAASRSRAGSSRGAGGEASADPGDPRRPARLYGNVFFHELQVLSAKGYHVLYTNPRGSRGYGERFCGEIAGSWGNLDYQDLMAALDLVIQRPDVDAERLGVAGGSYGGYMTNWIVGHTDRFKAAITMRCLSNFVSFYGTSDIGPWFGSASSARRGTRSSSTGSLAAGPRREGHDADPDPPRRAGLRCLQEQAEQWFVALRRLGKTAELVRFPEESHDMSRSGRPDRRLLRLGRIVAWFDRWLKD